MEVKLSFEVNEDPPEAKIEVARLMTLWNTSQAVRLLKQYKSDPPLSPPVPNTANKIKQKKKTQTNQIIKLKKKKKNTQNKPNHTSTKM